MSEIDKEQTLQSCKFLVQTTVHSCKTLIYTTEEKEMYITYTLTNKNNKDNNNKFFLFKNILNNVNTCNSFQYNVLISSLRNILYIQVIFTGWWRHCCFMGVETISDSDGQTMVWAIFHYLPIKLKFQWVSFSKFNISISVVNGPFVLLNGTMTI